MAYESLLYDVADRVATLTLNRPEKRNALNAGLLREFDDVLRAVEADDAASVLIIKGAGATFCAGYDLASPPADPNQPPPRADIMQDRLQLQGFVRRWLQIWDLRKPVIAQIHGYCLAGGSELALMCDLKVAAENAQIGFPPIRAQGSPVTQIYPWLLGINKAKELLLTGDTVSGAEAAAMGLVNRTVPPDQLESEVRRLATRIAAIPLDLLTMNKVAVNRMFEVMGFRTALLLGAEYDTMAHFTRPVREFNRMMREKGVRAAIEERDAPFRG